MGVSSRGSEQERIDCQDQNQSAETSPPIRNHKLLLSTSYGPFPVRCPGHSTRVRGLCFSVMRCKARLMEKALWVFHPALGFFLRYGFE